VQTADTMCLQVWNANACTAVVGAFNLQGSAWDRRKRQYTTYTAKPPTISAEVRVKDVPVFASPATAVSVGSIQYWLSCDQENMQTLVDQASKSVAQSCGRRSQSTLCLLQTGC
jgi:raffinose synthase